jgi:hypothetical protein
MLKDVTGVRPLAGYRLHIQFEDGVEGIVDLTEIVSFTGIFAPLKDRAYFTQVYVNPDVGTVCWPNDADIGPDVLYALVTGEPIPSFAQTPHIWSSPATAAPVAV